MDILKTFTISLFAAAALTLSSPASAAVDNSLGTHNSELFGLFCCCDWCCDSCDRCDRC